MKKQVLNISSLQCGRTSSSLVLNQVDLPMPRLVPSVDADTDFAEFSAKWGRIHPSFRLNPESTLDEKNQYILDFNLSLQSRFKEMGHDELYMMDDTGGGIRPAPSESSQDVDRRHMHTLNGVDCCSSSIPITQMNVLFPRKKMTSKSLYSGELKVQTPEEQDDDLELQRCVTLSGQVSSEKTLQGIAVAGGNLFTLTPNIQIGSGLAQYNNGILVFKGASRNQPYHFPNTMTLFQPSSLYDGVKKSKVVSEYLSWHDAHDGKTMVATKEEYGTSLSTLKVVGAGSYELSLATSGPTGIVKLSNDGKVLEIGQLDSATFRSKRASNQTYDGRYIYDNGDGRCGILFGLLDGFHSGEDRVLEVLVEKDAGGQNEKTSLSLEWEWVGKIRPQHIRVTANGSTNDIEPGKPLVLNSVPGSDPNWNSVLIRINVTCDIDWHESVSDADYRNALISSGVLLKDIRPANSVDSDQRHLTFGSYVNETGISDEEKKRRLDQFFQVSRFVKSVSYQMVMLSPLDNSTTNGISYYNSYPTGNVYADVFSTKSLLNSAYDMELSVVQDPRTGKNWLRAKGRNYIDLGQFGDQLYLVYQPMEYYFGTGGKVVYVGDASSPIPDEIGAKIGLDGNSRNPFPIVVQEEEIDEDADVPDSSETSFVVGSSQYQMVEVVRNINRFESAIKHKSNVFSVVVENSNLNSASDDDENVAKIKERLRNSVIQFVRNACSATTPVHTQLFNVQFT